MTEGLFKSFDPFAYSVNDVSALDGEVVVAFQENDTNKIKELINTGSPITVDVFITIDKHLHAYVLIAPTGNDSKFDNIQEMLENPNITLNELRCWRIDLRYEEIKQKSYQISIEYDFFKRFLKSLKKAYFIGRYENVRNPLCFQLAILRSAPRRYNAILSDCVEFAKEFCMCLLSYCSNGTKLEINVKDNIEKVTATGLIVEYLSRNFGSSGYLSNLFAGGTDVSSIFAGNPLVTVVVIILLLVYPVTVSLLVFYIYGNYIWN